MDFVECVGKTAVSKDGLENSLEDDIGKTAVQPLVLEHVKDKHHALTSCLRPYQMLQLLCKQQLHSNIIFHAIAQQLLQQIHPSHACIAGFRHRGNTPSFLDKTR